MEADCDRLHYDAAMSATGPATLDDIARHLGVHKSTVSRAMDPARRHLISPELLRRVETAVRELGYRPNRAAAALSTGRSRTVGVLLPDITNPVFPPILRGIEDALHAEGYFALLANTGGSDSVAQAALERMQAQRVEGLLVATAVRDDGWLDAVRASGMPIVLVNRSDGRGLLPAVVSDDMLAMRLAVDHLVALGHRHIAHLAGPAQLSTGLARRIGFEQALRNHGLQAAGIAEGTAYAVGAGEAAMRHLLAQRGAPPAAGRGRGKAAAAAAPWTAVVAANDLMALGALQALKQAGLAVPQQVSLVGHNDMPLLEHVTPPLSSVRIQHHAMGQRAAQLLLDRLAGRGGHGDATLMLRPELVLRASTAPPAAG
jgi:LacI family transcriptional regulator